MCLQAGNRSIRNNNETENKDIFGLKLNYLVIETIAYLLDRARTNQTIIGKAAFLS